jgi:hypothetical protein
VLSVNKKRKKTMASAVALALAGFAVLAPAASASFHLMQIREVYPGSAANPNAEYVELQMWAAGQNLVGGHVLRSFDASGALKEANLVESNAPGGANQSTILLATPEAESQFGFKADGALKPSGQLDPAAGAVCWESIDCVSWGAFAGSLQFGPTGSPAAPAGIPDGMALRRTIAPGCATLLEEGDDSNNSAADFAAGFPGPRPNSVAPSERPCGAAEETPTARPQTLLLRKPPKRTGDRTPTFRFRSSESGSSFQCRVDTKPFVPCRSPFTTRKLAFGRHTFKVQARDSAGNLDPSPASYAFTVLRKRR